MHEDVKKWNEIKIIICICEKMRERERRKTCKRYDVSRRCYQCEFVSEETINFIRKLFT